MKAMIEKILSMMGLQVCPAGQGLDAGSGPTTELSFANRAELTAMRADARVGVLVSGHGGNHRCDAMCVGSTGVSGRMVDGMGTGGHL